MRNWKLTVMTSTLIACCAGNATGAEGMCGDVGCAAVPDGIASMDELILRDLAGKMIHSLTPEEQRAIAQGHGIGSDALDLSDFSYEADRELPAGVGPETTPSEFRDLIVTPELDAKMTQGQRNMIDAIVETLEAGNQPPALCFSPDTDYEVAYAINQLIEFPLTVLFQQTTRWNGTATDGFGLQQGDPTTITYSYVPDGTFVPDLGIGLGSGNSQMFAWLNGIYGSPAAWQSLFDQVFDRWAELTGLSYVHETSDDGANLNGGAGVLGVRGDVRIAAYNFQNDGNFGVLAYNNFPQDGDMVFDAFDSFYNSTGNNSLAFRNVAAHEHGHGLGMLHVCPANQTKLMEPFISTAYDGPQIDDILNGHRHYGDPMEPNDSIAQASSLGSIGVGATVNTGNLSLDDNSEDDFFRFTLTEPARVIIILTPDADEYQQGTQTSQCNTGTLTDYDSIHNLRASIYEPGDLVNPALVMDDGGTGGSETLLFDAVSTGEYFIRVDTTSNTNSVQRYHVGLFTIDLPFLDPSISATVPEAVDPGVTTDFSVTIDPRDDTLVGGSTELFARVNGGSYVSSALSFDGGTSYTATLPAVDCGDSLEFYISAEGNSSGTITLPAAGGSAPFSAAVGTFETAFADDFETDTGWAVSGAVTTQATGIWQRGIPAGDGSRADASEDADGSGRCYVTGNGGAGSNTDVDGGDTVLTSPAFDVSGNPEATITYSRWFHNSFGDNANVEIFQVEISDDNGGSWTDLETVAGNSSESNGGWFEKTFRIADFVATTSQVRVRFIAKDDVGAVIEAGVDGVEVTGLSCEDPADCPADFTGEGDLNFLDVSAFLTAIGMQDPSADFEPDGSFNFLDVSAFLAAFAEGCP